ncbi:MAG: helix-hairpin-helix domain-containing protein [Planctomycetota bacterium]
MPRRQPPNDEIAEVLERTADLLEAQGANTWRVRAYRGGARTVRAAAGSLAKLLETEGAAALLRLPGIGRGIAGAVEEYVRTGRLRRLEHLEGEVSGEELFATLPGIGPDLARRIHETLGIESLEDLEVAAHDGRLEGVPGIGPQRTRAIRDALAVQLGSAARRRARRFHPIRGPDDSADSLPPPTVATLLDVDADYRRRAEAGALRRIAPRRFNPEGKAWLPIYHTEGGGYSFTAMYSNTARAHALGTTTDWVVIFYERDGREGQCTVVTERKGPLQGTRVVRGREAECARHHVAPSERKGGP